MKEEVFKKYEEQLRTAYYEDWSRNIPNSGLEALKQAYADQSGITLSYNGSCAECQLRFLKIIAKWYFEKPVYELSNSSLVETTRARQRRRTNKNS